MVFNTTDSRRLGWPRSTWYYRTKRAVANWDITPIGITLIYLVFGFLALYLSDVVFVQLIGDPVTLRQFQAAKGGFEVVATAGLIFVLTHRSRRSLNRANDRLQQQQEELQVLHRLLRHNLRNDMNVVHGYTASLLREVGEPRHREWCETVLDVAERIIRYTDRADDIHKVTRDGDRTVSDVSDTVGRLVETHPDLTDRVQVETSLPESAPVHANEMLSEALGELVSNAVVHNDTTEPTVALGVDPDAGPPSMTEVSIADNGPGIPAHVKRTIRERREDQLLHLDGLGLWFAYWTITTSRGVLTIDERDPRGSRIRIRLPKAAPRSSRTSRPDASASDR